MEKRSNIIEHYNAFKKNEQNVWLERFTWGGRIGKDPKVTTSMVRFFVETGILNAIERVNTADNLRKQVETLATQYVEWVKAKNNVYNTKEYDDMRKFFIGAIGEYFYVMLLNEVKCLWVPLPGNDRSNMTRIDFNYISPNLPGEDDYGFDLIGYANDVPSVFQVKFWKSFTKEPVEMEIFQKAFAEGIAADIINKDDKYNVFLCWIGTEENGNKNISFNKKFKERTATIGFDSLVSSVNGRCRIFWDNFYNSLANLREN